MVQEVDLPEGDLSDENEPMVDDTTAATVPLQPLADAPTDVEPAYALLRVQRDGGLAPVGDGTRWRRSVGNAAIEGWERRNQYPRSPAARVDGVAADSKTEPRPVDGGPE